MKSLVVALAVTASFGALTSYGQVLSPRAEANKTRVVAGTATDPDLLREIRGSVKSPRAQMNEIRIVSKLAHEVDTLAAIRNSKLSPRAQQQLGTGPQFEIAPMGKSKK